ncbi:hypothetical protein DACRYDRAFT_113245 [Dacryopinax primogenitus]|uniref:Caffeine-induced death protein 2 n=1 Tax=Dacryopinax primogenitus (strain DJM 731) TaxID=1858805 RepID=M5GFT7_DACPD|nr:uncharacterized protein DACRYDRAFT_113245 [Dacryopinax primogenitus]EJU06577.1 hypothetical protein DACRYDRAFT_113245 [Dacryopinax primogenitus]
MSRQQPALGARAIFTPPFVNEVAHVTPSTCFQLSLFKDLMRDLRKADDSITMRMNRNTAQFRDLAREKGVNALSEQEACLYFWRELMAKWKGRADIIDYCVQVVDAAAEEKRQRLQGKSMLGELHEDLERRTRGELYADEVQKRMIHNERQVETIVRERSMAVFKARCRFFEPPASDKEGRLWWDAAQSGR